MDELMYLVGCAVSLAIPIAGLAFLLRFHHRLKEVEETTGQLKAEIVELRALLAHREPARPTAPSFEAAVAVAPEPPEVPEPPRPAEIPAVAASPPEEAMPAEPPAAGPWWSGLEEWVGGKLLVWIGAAAMALGGAYLVMLSFATWGPAFRVTFGVLIGVALLGGGEWLRRDYPYPAQGLSAAGIASLFAAFYAAANLYQLIGPVAAFLLMALTTATAVALALRQGIVVATIGLVGGFLTPALVGSDESRPALLFGYLLLLQLGLVAVTRQRRWPILGGLTIASAFFWVLLFLSSGFRAEDTFLVGLFLLTSIAAFAGSILGAGSETAWGGVTVARWLGWGTFGGGMVVSGIYLSTADYGVLGWLFIGLLCLGCLVLGRFAETRYHGVPWLAALVAAMLLVAWSVELGTKTDRAYFPTLTLLGVLFAGGAYLAHRRAVYPGRWAALAAAAGVIFFLLAVARGTRIELEFAWGAVALVLAAIYVAGLVPVLRRLRDGEEEAARPVAALAVAATTLVSLAVPLELERQWMTVAWALEVWALFELAGRLAAMMPRADHEDASPEGPHDALSPGETLHKMAAVLIGLVVVRLVLNPMVLEYPIGDDLVFNWLAYGYGLPIAAFVMALRLARRQGTRKLAEALAAAVQALATVFLSLEIRHYFHPDNLDADRFALAEWGAYTVVWLLLVHGFLTAFSPLGWPERAWLWGSRALLAGTVIVGCLALGLAANPLWTHRAVGDSLIVNRLLWSYGVPAALLAWMAARLERTGSRRLAAATSVAALLTTFLFVTLEVRQGFHGTWLDLGDVTTAENYAYSIAWVLLGVGLAAGGVVSKRRSLRFAAMAVLVLAIGKVFIFDTAHLEGGFRVLSLMGLGAALLALAFGYQRFVVPLEQDTEASAEENGEEM